jgi:hypothetical protein
VNFSEKYAVMDSCSGVRNSRQVGGISATMDYQKFLYGPVIALGDNQAKERLFAVDPHSSQSPWSSMRVAIFFIQGLPEN